MKRSFTDIFSIHGVQKHQFTSKRTPVNGKKVSMETLSEEFKPVVLEKYELLRSTKFESLIDPSCILRVIKIPIEGTQ